MFVLDTNVVSELRKARAGKADHNVTVCAARIHVESLVSVITVLELGVRLLERRDATQGAVVCTWMNGHLMTAFAGRVLPIDIPVALEYAKLLDPWADHLE